jgi:RNA polymerase sigma-70 factor (ECF subfamily)
MASAEEAAALEAEVARLRAAGDLAGAATAAIRGLGPAVLRDLRSLLRDEEDAAEAFSQFAENLWKGLPAFRGEAALRTWAYRLAWNAAQNLRDAAWRRKGRRLATGEASALADEVRTKTAVVVERQRQALEKLRAALPVEDQSLLVLRVDQGLSWAEVAEVLAEEGRPVDPGALMKRFERLKEKLAKLAKEQGLLG